MNDAGPSPSGRPAASPAELVRPLLRVRQYRDFTAEAVTEAELDAIVDAARWSGSSQNGQPWRFIVLRDSTILGRVAEAGLPQTGALRNAVAAVAIVLPDDPGMALVHAYDEGRAAERALAAASLVGLGAGITWIRTDVRAWVRDLLGLPPDRFVRTIVAIGHPSDEARRPKSAPGTARLPRVDVVFEERWPEG